MTAVPVARRISSAAASSVDSVRAHSASLAPSLASPMATAFPKPWLDAATMATRSLSRRSMGSPPQVRVFFLEPIFADGAEYVEVERLFERHGAVRHARGNAQHLPLSDYDLAAADLELQRALADVGDLFALVVVFRHDRALGEENLRHHGLVARNDLARDGVAQDLFLHLVPSVEFHVLSSPCEASAMVSVASHRHIRIRENMELYTW